MFNTTAEKTTAVVLAIGAPLTTLFLTTGGVTDPVNATKLFVAGGFGFALISVLIGFQARETFSHFKAYVLSSLVFIATALNTVISSGSPITQNLYGSFGRNTGFIAYLVFMFASLGVLGLRNKSNFKKLILGLQFAGIVNVAYCAWVIAFGDFLSWNNPYGNILGLFGNPNFVSSFLGIFIATVLAFAANRNASWRYRGAALLVCLLAFYEIVNSNAIQGIVVTAGGIVLIGFFYVRANIKAIAVSYLYALLAIGLGTLAIFGALQKGPFSFVYKTSVSLRGAYWAAGTKMGLDHPFTGVGMDSYGDWYRRARSLNAATVLPGPNTFTNASHNVVIDFFAYGGWPLLLSYLGLVTIALISAIKVILRSRNYDPIFVAIFTGWVCYLTQSLISINQIGLAIWGWLLTGALVAYEFATRPESGSDEVSQSKKKKQRANKSTEVVSPQLIAGLGMVVGLIVAVPPLSADMKWRAALDSKDVNKVLQAVEPGYLSPSDSTRYVQAVQLFATNNFPEQAREVALNAIAYNPDHFESWRLFYFLTNTSTEEKAKALENMKRLDPLNPDISAQ